MLWLHNYDLISAPIDHTAAAVSSSSSSSSASAAAAASVRGVSKARLLPDVGFLASLLDREFIYKASPDEVEDPAAWLADMCKRGILQVTKADDGAGMCARVVSTRVSKVADYV